MEAFMIARKYNRRIEIWDAGTLVADGYGGNTITSTLIAEVWANVSQNSSFKDTTIGKSDVKKTYTFKVRNAVVFMINNLSNAYIIYNGKNYNITSVENPDDQFREITIIAHG